MNGSFGAEWTAALLNAVPRISNQQSEISNTPMDPAQQLQQIYMAGFEIETFDRFPKCIGVIRDGCVALLVPGISGLQILGTPGWRMGEVMGVLVEKDGRQVFQSKENIVEATPERLRSLDAFKHDLNQLLRPPQ
jgi:hypothetical protein